MLITIFFVRKVQELLKFNLDVYRYYYYNHYKLHVIFASKCSLYFIDFSAPGVPPPNLQIYDRYSTDSVNVSWNAIPKEQENGYLVGYKVSKLFYLHIPGNPYAACTSNGYLYPCRGSSASISLLGT